MTQRAPSWSLRSGPVADWLRELRQLKMRPKVLLVADRTELELV